MAITTKNLAANGERKSLPASFDVDATIRELVSEAIRDCNKSRAQLADEMSYLTGERISEHMLNKYSADSKADHRFPLAFAAAFCHATGDGRLLEAIAAKLQLALVRPEEEKLLQLGRLALESARTAGEFEGLRAQLAGGTK
jgi:hypothetical protein